MLKGTTGVKRTESFGGGAGLEDARGQVGGEGSDVCGFTLAGVVGKAAADLGDVGDQARVLMFST